MRESVNLFFEKIMGEKERRIRQINKSEEFF